MRYTKYLVARFVHAQVGQHVTDMQGAVESREKVDAPNRYELQNAQSDEQDPFVFRVNVRNSGYEPTAPGSDST